MLLFFVMYMMPRKALEWALNQKPYDSAAVLIEIPVL